MSQLNLLEVSPPKSPDPKALARQIAAELLKEHGPQRAAMIATIVTIEVQEQST